MRSALVLIILLTSSAALASPGGGAGGGGSHGGGSAGGGGHASVGGHAGSGGGHAGPGSHGNTFTSGSHVTAAIPPQSATREARTATVEPTRPSRPGWWRRHLHWFSHGNTPVLSSICTEDRRRQYLCDGRTGIQRPR